MTRHAANIFMWGIAGISNNQYLTWSRLAPSLPNDDRYCG
jgi:hypothetical protein